MQWCVGGGYSPPGPFQSPSLKKEVGGGSVAERAPSVCSAAELWGPWHSSVSPPPPPPQRCGLFGYFIYLSIVGLYVWRALCLSPCQGVSHTAACSLSHARTHPHTRTESAGWLLVGLHNATPLVQSASSIIHVCPEWCAARALVLYNAPLNLRECRPAKMKLTGGFAGTPPR